MNVILSEGQSKVIEFEEAGQLKRRILPVDSDEVELGIPYGLPFAALLWQNGMDERMSSRIEQELHRAGLWTALDLQQNTGAVQGAIQAAYGIDTAILLNLARKYGG